MTTVVPTPYDDAVSDFEAAFERLVNAYGDKDEQRRAWLETLNHTYRLREYRRQRYDGTAGQGAYYVLVASHEFGKITEGIVVVRNIATHVLAVRADPESRMIYPSSKLYPSDYLYPGDGNLFWLDMHELAPAAAQQVSAADMKEYYKDKVAGFLVLGTLLAVREFLINDVTNSFT